MNALLVWKGFSFHLHIKLHLSREVIDK